jgi:hypothetical protein
MTEPDGVEDGSLGGVRADLSTPTDRDHFSSEFEGALIELVQADGCSEPWTTAAPWDGDVDRGWDRVDEVMPR